MAPVLPRGDEIPALPDIAALQRRRLSRLGRAVVHVVSQVQQQRSDMPLVFASRYGDVERALAALGALDSGEPLSPTAFAGSVHNAIAAMHSIIGVQRQNMVSVAAGAGSAAAGLVEAAGLLADGADEVLLTSYDEPLPPPYERFADEPQALYAWAWRIAAPRTGEPALRLARDRVDASTGERSAVPAGLGVLHWLLGSQRTLLHSGGALGWRWSRDG